MSPLVSVVVPAYNCEAYLGDALTSVYDQRYSPLEVLVIDDGSTDGTAEVARSFPSVRYVRQSNSGPSAARNRGIQLARGELIAFLDADDVWAAGILREQVALLQFYPEAGLSFADMREFSVKGNAHLSMFERHSLNQQYFGHPEVVVEPIGKLMQMNFIPTGSVLARRQALFAAGLFDENRRMVEDWDLWLRVAIRYPLVYSVKVWELKRTHAQNVSRDLEAMTRAALDVLEQFKQKNRAALGKKEMVARQYLRAGYRNLGYFYLRQLSLQKARGALRRSLGFGVDGRAVVYLASTFLGAGFIRTLLRARG